MIKNKNLFTIKTKYLTCSTYPDKLLKLTDYITMNISIVMIRIEHL